MATVITGGALLGSGPAVAASPILVGSCATTISGVPGQPITLSGVALVAPITAALNGLPLGGDALAAQVNGVVTPLQIPLGVVPNAPTTLSGSQIASSTSAALRGTPLGDQSALGAITPALTSGCSILVTVANSAGGAVQGASGAVAQAVQSAAAALPKLPAVGGGTPLTGLLAAASPVQSSPAQDSTPQGGTTPLQGASTAAGSPSPGAGPTYSGSVDRAQLGDLLSVVPAGNTTQYSFGHVPLYSYAGTPYAAAPGAGRAASPSSLYGSSVSGYAPKAGTLGSNGSAGAGDGITKASQVEALGSAPTPDTVGFLTLLAVLLLSGTSAVVVRTWVLRRTGQIVMA